MLYMSRSSKSFRIFPLLLRSFYRVYPVCDSMCSTNVLPGTPSPSCGLHMRLNPLSFWYSISNRALLCKSSCIVDTLEALGAVEARAKPVSDLYRPRFRSSQIFLCCCSNSLSEHWTLDNLSISNREERVHDSLNPCLIHIDHKVLDCLLRSRAIRIV